MAIKLKHSLMPFMWVLNLYKYSIYYPNIRKRCSKVYKTLKS